MGEDSRVAIITPVKNEEDNLPDLITAVKEQTTLPYLWVIVDDSSTDGSPEIIEQAENNTKWIDKLEHNSEAYDVGENVSNVIKSGYLHVEKEVENGIDYYMVLDGDMRISKNYIEKIASFLDENEDVVIASGGVYIEKSGDLVLENRRENHPAGGATLFESHFLRKIDGFPTVPGWDSATKGKARLRGYKSRYLSGLDVQAVQSRPTGGKGDKFKAMKMRGSINYQQNLHPIVVFLRFLNILREYPYFPAFGYLLGYITAVISREDQISDPELRNYYWSVKLREVLVRLTKLKNE